MTGARGHSASNCNLNAAIPAWAAMSAPAASPVDVVDQFTGFDVNADTKDGVHSNDNGSKKIAMNC